MDEDLKAEIKSENKQQADNADTDAGSESDYYDLLFSLIRIKRVEKLESKLSKLDPETERLRTSNFRALKAATHTDAGIMAIGKHPTLNYCRETKKSWFGRALIMTNRKNPNRKHLFCLICWKANKGKPYRNRNAWHYLEVSPRGYDEQAVLTAIAANCGKSISDIAAFCRRNFKNGKFSYGNVYAIIKQYAARGMVELKDGGYKNNKKVYRC